jgi:hypothetical protein
MGELLPQVLHGESHDVTFLDDLGISGKQSERYQQLSLRKDTKPIRLDQKRGSLPEFDTVLNLSSCKVFHDFVKIQLTSCQLI